MTASDEVAAGFRRVTQIAKDARVTTSIGSIEATDGTPPETPPDDGKFHLWFNTNGVEA